MGVTLAACVQQVPALVAIGPVALREGADGLLVDIAVDDRAQGLAGPEGGR